MSKFLQLIKSKNLKVEVKKVKGCPDLKVAIITIGKTKATAVLHDDGNINARNQFNQEIYDGYDGQTAAQKIISWITR